MTKTRFQQFMDRYDLSQYRLHKMTGFSKSQVSEWQRGLHRPSKKSALRISLAVGLPFEYLLAQIETRECYENDIAPTGEFIARQKKNRPAPVETNDATRTDGVYCMTCGQMLEKAA